MSELEQVAAQLAELKGILTSQNLQSVTPITIDELVNKAMRITSSSSKRTYQHGWKVLRDGLGQHKGFGHRNAHEIRTSDFEELLPLILEQAKASNGEKDKKRNAVGRVQRHGNGKGAVYNAIGAWRRLFRIAENDGHITKGSNPAAPLKTPSRNWGTRNGLTPLQVSQLIDTVKSGGDDPDLDLMLVWFHLITGARQEGALNLRRRDVEARECMVVLDEKNDNIARQPVPDWFALQLLAFADSRGAIGADDKVFQRKRGDKYIPITRRRYNSLFERVQSTARWADETQVTSHVLRHTAAHFIERQAGKAVAEAFLRHSIKDVTARYTRATSKEVAKAVIELWGGTHPLA